MGVTWKRRSEIEDGAVSLEAKKSSDTASFDLIQSRKDPSTRSFVLPPTLESDFERQLKHDHPNHFTFQLLKDWYDQDDPKYIRASQVPIDWKSNIGAADMTISFKVAKSTKIRKGDMVIREDGTIYLLDWNVQNNPNNWSTQSVECNARTEFTRKVPDQTDNRGMQIASARTEVIAPMLPVLHTEYAGRPDYAAAQGTPGINADHLITVKMQWNSKTRKIRVDDEFVLGSYTYRVINVSIAEVQIDKQYGILCVNAKRIAGGSLDDEV